MLLGRRYIELIKKIIVMILVVAMTIPNTDYKVVRGDEIENDNIYKVTFYSEDGGIRESSDYEIHDGNKVIIDVYDGDSVYAPFMKDREGYKLVGWRLQGTNEIYYDSYEFSNYEDDNLKCIDHIMNYQPNKDVTFVPVWKEAYRVEYYTEDGYLNEMGYMNDNSKIVVTTVVKGLPIDSNIAYGERDEFVLVGWKEEETNKVYLIYDYKGDEEDSISNYIPTKDTRFEAVWGKTAMVSLYSEKGYVEGYNSPPGPDDKSFSDTLVIGEKITKYSNWLRYAVKINDYGLDYNFLGWKIEGDDTLYVTKDKWYYPNEEYPDGVKCIYDYVIKGDVQFIAVWEEKEKFDIEYYSEEGYITESENYECIDGKKVIFQIEEGKNINSNYFPQMNERENYVFVGWKVEGTNDVYYTYDSYYSAASKIYNYNELYYYKPDGNTRLIAVWMEKNVYNIEFYSEEGYLEGDLNNKSEVIQVDSLLSIGYENLPSAKDREGYVFVGWMEEKTGNIYYTSYYGIEYNQRIANYIPTEDTRFIAVWEEACTITFYSEEGFINEEDNKEFSYTVAKGIEIGDDNYPNMNVREDYECVGWKNEKTGDVYYADYAYRSIGIDYIYNYIPEKDTKFIAIWKKCCNVTFYSDNGVDVEWIWTEDGDNYNIIYEKTYKTVIDMPICNAFPDYDDEDIQGLDEKDGAILVGWKNMETGDVYSYARWYYDDEDKDGEYSEYGIDDIRNFVPTKDTRFEAVWKKTYKLTYKSEFGIWYDEDGDEYTYETCDQVIQGKKIEWAPGVSVNKDGYVFVGWKEEGTNDIYYSERWYKYYKEYAKKNIEDIVSTKDMNFIAVWEKADYTISFYSKVPFYTDGMEGPDVYDYVEKNGGYEWKYSELPSVGVDAPFWTWYLGEKYKKYRFLGWKLEGDNSGILYKHYGGEQAIEDIGEYNVPEGYADFDTLEINKDMRFIALWKYITDDGEEIIIGEDNKKTEDADGVGGDYVKDNQKDIKANDKKEQNASVGVKQVDYEKIPKISEVISDGNNEYKVTKVSKENGKTVGELSIKKWKDKKSSKIVIKDSVDIKGITYKITSIEKNAFKNTKNLKTLVIGKSITKIGACAFAGCKNLRKVYIKSLNIKKIGKKAFYRKKGKKLIIKVPAKFKKKYKKVLKKAGTNNYNVK